MVLASMVPVDDEISMPYRLPVWAATVSAWMVLPWMVGAEPMK